MGSSGVACHGRCNSSRKRCEANQKPLLLCRKVYVLGLHWHLSQWWFGKCEWHIRHLLIFRQLYVMSSHWNRAATATASPTKRHNKLGTSNFHIKYVEPTSVDEMALR